jgi:hypothetical protein
MQRSEGDRVRRRVRALILTLVIQAAVALTLAEFD